MGQNDYKEDLEYLFAALLSHPAVIRDEKKKAELEALYFAQETTICDYDSFIDAATKLTVSLQDGHTNLEIPYENLYLVRSRMIHYPYQNYHMFSQMNLRMRFC